MSEELRIIVTDSGGGGGGGGSGRAGVGPVGVGGGGTTVSASVSRLGALGNVITGVGQGVGMAAFNAIKGTAVRAASLPGRAFGALTSEVSDLQGLSAPLAEAVQESNIRSFNIRARRAQALGGSLAGFEKTRSEISSKLSDLWTEILKILLAFFEASRPLIEKISANIEKITDVLARELPNFMEGLADSLPFWFDGIKDPLRIMAREVRKIHERVEQAMQDNVGDFFDQMMEQLGPVGFWPGDQRAPGERDRAFRRRRRNGF